MAVIAVILSHTFFERTDIYLLRFFSGGWGVTLFFVISGFLITTLLLREYDNSGKISVRSFYLRRAVRILPPAYIFLLTVWVLAAHEIIQVSPTSLLSAFLFLKNLPIPGVPHEWHLGHFWSLAVEEQYYLMLPVLLLVARRRLALLCGVMIGISLAATYLYFHVYRNSFAVKMFSAVVLHLVPLLIGSLFALLNHRFPEVKRKIPAVLGFLCLVLSMATLSTENHLLPKLIQPLFSAVAAGSAILGLINVAHGTWGLLLNNVVSDFIGRISYSLYLWQQLFTNQSVLKVDGSESYVLLLNLLALFLCALGSYFLIEKPLFGLRERLRSSSPAG